MALKDDFSMAKKKQVVVRHEEMFFFSDRIGEEDTQGEKVKMQHLQKGRKKKRSGRQN